jgi:hypothetical protein
MRRTLILTIALLGLSAVSASADQPLCPTATGGANASAVAQQYGPFICAA